MSQYSTQDRQHLHLVCVNDFVQNARFLRLGLFSLADTLVLSSQSLYFYHSQYLWVIKPYEVLFLWLPLIIIMERTIHLSSSVCRNLPVTC